MVNKRSHILFVDDEPDALARLRILLSAHRQRWDFVFALGSESALAEIRKQKFDAVISDLRMPKLDGVSLLRAVMQEQPTTARLLCANRGGWESDPRVLSAVHQAIPKPYTEVMVRDAIGRNLSGAPVELDARLEELARGLSRLPAPPAVYYQLAGMSSVRGADAACVLARNPALLARLLPLVQLATRQRLVSIQHAVRPLGIQRLRYLALIAEVLSTSHYAPRAEQALQELRQNAVRVALKACELADPDERDAAFVAGLLHDIGHIVFVPCAKEVSVPPAARAWRSSVGCDLGTAVAVVGARLLAIWRVSSTIVDAVRFQADPERAPRSARRLAGVVHRAAIAARPTTSSTSELQL